MNRQHTLTFDHSRLIADPIEKLWQRHTQLDGWPSWNTDIVAVNHEPPLAPDTTFAVITATGSWRVQLYAFVPEARLLIWGYRLADGCTWLQSWTFEHSGTAVRVSASTTVSGTVAPARIQATAARLHRGVKAWMDRLQPTVEARAFRDT